MGELSDYMRDMINMQHAHIFETDSLTLNTDSEISPSVVQNAAMELMQIDINDIDALHTALANFSSRFGYCDGLNVQSLENLDDFLCQLLQNPQTVFALQHILTSIIAYLKNFPQNARRFMDEDIIVTLLQLVENIDTDNRSVCLALNVINRLTVINPSIKEIFYANNFIHVLIDRLNICGEIEIKNECWLCSWSILHTDPHPDFSQIQDFTPFLEDLFESPDDPCFMKKIMLISAFVECSNDAAFITTNYISTADALNVLLDAPPESQYVIFELFISLMESGETNVVNTILDGLAWDWLPVIAENSTDENKTSAVRFITAVFLSDETTDQCVVDASEEGVFDILFSFLEESHFALLRWSALAVLCALRNHYTVLFNTFINDFDFLQKCVSFLELSSTRVAKYTGLCLQSVFMFCSMSNHPLADIFKSHELSELLDELVDDQSPEICSAVAETISDIREEFLG